MIKNQIYIHISLIYDENFTWLAEKAISLPSLKTWINKKCGFNSFHHGNNVIATGALKPYCTRDAWTLSGIGKAPPTPRVLDWGLCESFSACANNLRRLDSVYERSRSGISLGSYVILPLA